MAMPLRIRSTGVAGLLCVMAAGASADQLMVNGVPPVPATIHDFRDGRLVYYTPRGDEASRDYARVDQISVDGEPALNDAEAAFAQGQKDQSVDNYIRAIRSTNKPWVKLFAARRIKDAVPADGRFDARLAAYLAVLTVTPDDAPKQKPQLPDAGSRYLQTAVDDVEAALKTPKLSDAQQLNLLNFLIDIQRRQGDQAAVTSTLERIARVSGGKSTDPAVLSQLATLKVTQAQLAFDNKDYKQAASLIQEVRPMLNEPNAQSDAMLLLARLALVNADKTDKSAMQDAALAFMRVVAHFDDVQGKPNVLPAMQQAAAILEQTGDKAGAITLLGQISDEFPNDPAAAKARETLERLKKG